MKKQHRLLHVAMLLVLAMACGSLWAQAPSGYYDGAAGKKGAELRLALHNIIKGHTSITYTQIWQAYWSTDNKGDNVVWDMYSDGANYSFSYQNGNDQCGSYSREGDCYNREHSWPQSWFNEQSTPRTDLHHVFPTDGYVNNRRGNHPFGEVGSVSWTSQNGSKLGTCRTSGYSGTVFEPIDEYKGDFARAYFYMSTRYYTEDGNWSTSGMTDKADIRPWAVAMLLRWHEADPVSQKEIDRNNVIYNDIQHNRNPFVDHPEYARMIWDNDWSSTYYAIIYQQSVHGNITGITQAVQGASVSITAIADFGYMVDSYSVWKTDDPSTTVTVSENGVFVMPDFDVTVSVTFVENINYYAITTGTVQHGSIRVSTDSAISGTHITMTATPEIGYDLESWVVTDAYGGTVDVVDNQFVMPACNVTVSANFIYVGNAYEQKYYLVTSTEQLVANRTYLVVNINAGKALGSLQNENNRAAVPVEIQNNTIASIGSAVCELTLGGSMGAWTLFDANWGEGGGYLYAAHSSYNQLRTQEVNDSNGTWTISIDGDGVATIVAQGENLRNILRYNSNSGDPIFNCYAEGQQQDVSLFVRSEEFEYTESVTLANLNTFDNHIIRSGATVVANQVSGKDLCNNAYQIILEGSAQFVHGEAGIKALAKKAITAYSGNGGWYTISMPFSTLDPDEVENMTAADYDLYAYDEDGDTNGKEWINHKSNGGFSLSPSAGYLYAHNPAITLRMEGTLNVGIYSETVNLGYANGNASLQGFNLLGNPVAHDISFTKTAEVSDGYYYLANSNNWVYETGNTVPVGRGFMVKANASNQSVTLNPQSKRGEDQKKGQFLCVSVGEEKAYVKLNEGLSMPLLDMRGHHSRLYLQSERQPYVMLVRDGAEVLDLCYEAHGNGPQTLKVDTDGLGLNSLHLIDNKTGANVDLLATSSYQFEAKEGDYVTRFRLVFGPSTDSGSEGSTPFAYYADGEIRLSETCHDALLQIVDMTGRVVFMGDVSGNVSTKGMTPGVYVLRLVADDGIRVQKMVLK